MKPPKGYYTKKILSEKCTFCGRKKHKKMTRNGVEYFICPPCFKKISFDED